MADTPHRLPVSTYRLQFHRGFRFTDAQALVPYLWQLGVTDCYTSPYLKARPGSTHGYDICDHNQLNPEVGTQEEYAAFTAALAAREMGQLVDFVPNHMGIDEQENVWWRDVLENGPCSPYSGYFDIEWHPVKDELEEKVLLPILGDQYGLALERGEIQVAYESGSFTLHYYDHNLPINPRQFPKILEHDLESLRRDLDPEDPALVELLSIATALRNLPAYTETEPGRIAERHREKEVARDRLERLVDTSPRVRTHIDSAVHAFNGKPGESESFDLLHELLEAQPYRLAYWRTASHEINYRRFFDINQLAGLRMEDPEVFASTHGLLLQLVGEGKVTGIRLDHIDGLFDPAQYLKRLQEAIRARRPGPPDLPFFIAVEKILSTGESLPQDWPVAGTSGYDFLNDLNRLFVDRRGQRTLSRVYRRFTGQRDSFADVVYASKKFIMEAPMASELNVLAYALNRLSEANRRTRDFTLNSLREALREVVACFPTYRTYVSPRGFSPADRQSIEGAIHEARRRNPTTEPSIFQFLHDVLLPDPALELTDDDRLGRVFFAMKLQQYSGPVQAKGVEDTAFYRYNLLASLNEVGGDPERFGCSPGDFHAANWQRRERWPAAMLASATHDTKRGEDVRARLNVLSEIAEEWGRYLSGWARINGSNRSIVDGQPAPSRNDEYLFYQALLGTWPPGRESLSPGDDLVARLREYMLKAVREAKARTSWTTQNQAYESALSRFAERTLTGATSRRFLPSFLPFQSRVARLGAINSLSQLLLKAVSPGVADFYQGTELWDLSLVDPDNRRPVDYGLRQQMLDQIEPVLASADADQRAAAARDMLAHWGDGRVKMFLTTLVLRLRRRLPALFLHGTYEALEARGDQSESVVALARRHDSDVVFAVAPRLLTRLPEESQALPIGAACWGETRVLLPQGLSPAAYRNAATGEMLRLEATGGEQSFEVAAALRSFPLGLFVGRVRA